ncbi:MAG: tryptophan--tRNA ligase, partial [Firmicutes bacterium]|nr:tryptophan--tRNA ligase [Bacillota bacterium]
MAQSILVTGIKPTGTPHLGNYIGAIQPALQLAQAAPHQAYYFIADYHALTFLQNAEAFRRLSYEVAATWLAMGLDPKRIVFYRQSDIPEVFELNWILACFTPKGLMNRAHAYKAVVQANLEAHGSEAD